ncbi:MAG: hypothetical protein JNK63_01570 [Chthonomonas sp.]|nr:hypothetical protein [Chthonomonas sp.]
MKPIIWTVSLVLASSAAYAQREFFNASLTGSGTLTRAGDPNRLYRAEINLQENGYATISLIGEKRWTYQGNWREYGQDDYMIDIRNAYGDRNARGTAQISIVRGEVEAIIVRDGYADNTRFSANFDVRGGSGNNQGGNIGSGTTRGNGNYMAPNSRGRDVSSVSHSFNSNGTFTIRPSGGETFSGRYSRSGNYLRLTITQVGNQRVSSSSGNATISNRSLERASLSARTSRGTYSFSWRGYADGNSDYGRPFRFDERGEGDATGIEGRDLDLTRVTGDFRQDGRFTIWLYDDNRRISVEGRWNDGSFNIWDDDDRRGGRPDDRNWTDDRIVLDITKYDGRSATGTGTYDRSRSGNSIFSRLVIMGTADRRKFMVSFRPRR